MATAVDEAQRERELTKESLARNVDRLEQRVRSELDWKSRLRRDGARYAVLGGIIVGVGVTAFVLRRTLRGDKPEPEAPGSLEEIAAELRSIRKQLDSGKSGGGGLGQKIALRVISGAAAAAGTYAAKQLMARSEGEDGGNVEGSAGVPK